MKIKRVDYEKRRITVLVVMMFGLLLMVGVAFWNRVAYGLGPEPYELVREPDENTKILMSYIFWGGLGITVAGLLEFLIISFHEALVGRFDNES